MRSTSVWASDYRFLNDPTEFRYGVEVFKRHFESYRQSKNALHSKTLMEMLSQRLEGLLREHTAGIATPCVFVASFSLEPDLLSQWRGYNGGRGFSLGLNTQWVDENARTQGFEFTPMAYDKTQQAQAVFDRLKVLSAKHLEDNEDHDSLDGLWENALRVILALKHPAYSEEREYRAVKVMHTWSSKVKTRATGAGLVPYLPLSLSEKPAIASMNHPQNKGFEHIIVGPALHARQRAAVDALQASLHMRFDVTLSDIPYVAD